MSKSRWRIVSGFAVVCTYAAVLQAAPKPPEYADDLGPDTIDVSAYSADMQAGYKKFEAKCAVCHSAARAVNSDLVTSKEWERYIKRMWQRPPCCNLCPVISKADAKAIWKFLTYDSQIRKTGPNAEAWQKHHHALLAEFKARYPKKYQEHYGVIERKKEPL